MKTLSRVLCIAMVSLISAGRGFATELINLNFGKSYTGMAVSPAGTDSDTWNYINYASLSSYNLNNGYAPDKAFKLLDSKNLETTVELTQFSSSSLNNISSYTAFPGNTLMNSYAQATPGHTGTIEFTGLTPGTYKLYVYSQNEKNTTNYAVSITANGVTFSTQKSDGTLDHFVSPDNYATAIVTVSSDTALSISFTGIGGQGDINGIQIESIEAVPEPENITLLGIGGILVFGFMKRKTKEHSLVKA